MAHAQPFRNPFPSHRGFSSQFSAIRAFALSPLALLPARLAQHSADEPFRLLFFRFPDFGALVRPGPPLLKPVSSLEVHSGES